MTFTNGGSTKGDASPQLLLRMPTMSMGRVMYTAAFPGPSQSISLIGLSMSFIIVLPYNPSYCTPCNYHMTGEIDIHLVHLMTCLRGSPRGCGWMALSTARKSAPMPRNSAKPSWRLGVFLKNLGGKNEIIQQLILDICRY